MNFENLQQAWKQLDKKIAAEKVISEKTLMIMISERSKSTLSKMKRAYLLKTAMFLPVACLLICCILFNPFDYKNIIAFIPLAAQATAMILLLMLLAFSYQNIITLTPLPHDDLAGSLKKIIRLNSRNLEISAKVLLLLITAGTLFPLSFMPRIIEKRSLVAITGLTLLPFIISIVIYRVSQKLQLFKNSHLETLKNDLKELEEMYTVHNEPGN